MRRPLILLPLAAGFSCALMAQTLSPQVVANGGGYERTTALTLEWTLGQLATESVELPGGLLTQGFHQPSLLVVPWPARADAQSVTRIAVFPNPSVNELNVRAEGEGSERYTVLQLLDMGGRLITERSGVDLLRGYRLDIAHLPAGTYHLRLSETEGELPQSFTVIKIN